MQRRQIGAYSLSLHNQPALDTITARARTNRTSMPYASPALRDQFLSALDAQDRARCTELAINLAHCSNPLPGMACDQLGLPIGSTYACAAQRVLLMYSVVR